VTLRTPRCGAAFVRRRFAKTWINVDTTIGLNRGETRPCNFARARRGAGRRRAGRLLLAPRTRGPDPRGFNNAEGPPGFPRTWLPRARGISDLGVGGGGARGARTGSPRGPRRRPESCGGGGPRAGRLHTRCTSGHADLPGQARPKGRSQGKKLEQSLGTPPPRGEDTPRLLLANAF